MKMFKFQNQLVSKKIYFLLLLVLFAVACNSTETQSLKSLDYDDNFEVMPPEVEVVEESSIGSNIHKESNKRNDENITNNEKPASYNRKLIKTGSIQYETKDPKSSRLEIEKLVKKHHAFIANETNNNYSHKIEQNLSIRIPFEHFDAFIADLSGSVAHFDYKNINVKDVTEEYIDIQSRLKAKYKLEESFLALLKKALKIKDILEIEKELNNVRSEIERMEGRLRYLKDQVSLSTLNIVFYKNLDVSYKAEKGFFAKLWYNFQEGFSGLLSFTLGLVSIWPFLIILSIVIFFIRKWWKNRK